MRSEPHTGLRAGRTPLVLSLALSAILLAACGTPQKPLYQWNGYQAGLYEHFKTNGAIAADQAVRLEEQLIKNKAAGEATPPGLHGHLALLYAKLGNDDAAVAHLEAERALFPESAGYVDFLLKKNGRSAVGASDAATGAKPATSSAALSAASTAAASPTSAARVAPRAAAASGVNR